MDDLKVTKGILSHITTKNYYVIAEKGSVIMQFISLSYTVLLACPIMSQKEHYYFFLVQTAYSTIFY